MESANTQGIEPLQLSITLLSQTGAALASFCAQASLPESKANAILSEMIEAECELCGIKIPGPELIKLQAAQLFGTSLPKLQRLRLGYCARNSCESQFYRLNFRPHPEISAAQLRETIVSKLDLFPTLRTEAPVHSRFNRAVLLRTAAGIVLGAILFVVVRHWIYGTRIPLLQKVHHYEANPNPE